MIQTLNILNCLPKSYDDITLSEGVNNSVKRLGIVIVIKELIIIYNLESKNNIDSKNNKK